MQDHFGGEEPMAVLDPEQPTMVVVITISLFVPLLSVNLWWLIKVALWDRRRTSKPESFTSISDVESNVTLSTHNRSLLVSELRTAEHLVWANESFNSTEIRQCLLVLLPCTLCLLMTFPILIFQSCSTNKPISYYIEAWLGVSISTIVAWAFGLFIQRVAGGFDINAVTNQRLLQLSVAVPVFGCSNERGKSGGATSIEYNCIQDIDFERKYDGSGSLTIKAVDTEDSSSAGKSHLESKLLSVKLTDVPDVLALKELIERCQREIQNNAD